MMLSTTADRMLTTGYTFQWSIQSKPKINPPNHAAAKVEIKFNFTNEPSGVFESELSISRSINRSF